MDMLEELCCTCPKGEMQAGSCHKGCELYTGISNLLANDVRNRTYITDLEAQVLASEGAARHYFNMVVKMKVVLCDALDL